jgi:hypothetical protein
LETVAIPAFDSTSPLHQRLAALSQRAHALARPPAHHTLPHALKEPRADYVSDGQALADVERDIDAAAAELWGITPAELEEIRRSLDELG